LHDRAKPLFAIFETTITRKGMIFGKPGTGFSKRSCSNLQRPAAIRPLGVTGTMPVTGDKDGRHPKHQNHGRIAGR
jgi:hypothetical protein